MPATELREEEALHVAGLANRYQADLEMVRSCQRGIVFAMHGLIDQIFRAASAVSRWER